MKWVTKHCLICGPEEKVRTLYPQNFKYEELTPEIFSARRQTEHFHYTVVRCQNCGLVFSREILPEEALSRFYSQSKVTFQEYAGIIQKDYWQPLAPFLNGSRRGRALEIGCSSGFFLEILQRNGFSEVFGCEPSTEVATILRRQLVFLTMCLSPTHSWNGSSSSTGKE